MNNWLLGGMLADLFEIEAVIGLLLLALVIGLLVRELARDGLGPKLGGQR